MATRHYFLFCLILATGCYGSNQGMISGTVTYKGEKVPSGTVSILVDGQLFQGEIENGFYEVTNIPAGQAKIAVVRLDPNQPDPYEALNKARRQMIEKKAADPKEIDPAVVTDSAQLDALQKKRHMLPYFYASPETSDLRIRVAAGINTFDINLQEKSTSK